MNYPRAAFALVSCLLAGCAAMPAAEPERGAPYAAANRCMAWYAALDRRIDDAGVRDAGETRIAGFPYLRADRFATSFRDAARADPKLRAQLVSYLAGLDLHARRLEIANLPSASRADEFLLALCAGELTAADSASAIQHAALLDRLVVPDDYASAKRVLGAYALSAIPFFAGVTRWQDDTQAIFATAKSGEGAHRYTPAPFAEAPAGRSIIDIERDAMGIPQSLPHEWQSLLARHAPVLDIVARSAADRFGAVQWREPGLEVNTDAPYAYTRVAFTRFQGETLVQLVYTYWFPERPLTGAFDLLGGRLDGLMVRITLDRDGTPMLVDSIHACGCYQLFFPTPRLSPRPAPESGIEWAFVPKRLPDIGNGERVVLRVAAGTHYLEDIGLIPDTAAGTPYNLASEHDLRSLPLPDGSHRSLYGPDGIVAGSERGERFLFWPMGIASPGAMRQWGRHATAFVGRRQFDDADLIERRFERTK